MWIPSTYLIYKKGITPMNRPNTVCFYDGPSMLDGIDIVALASGLKIDSDNPKTAAMLQVDILLKDIKPQEAIKTGKDISICGVCTLRGNECYVNAWQSQTQKWLSFQRGNVPTMSPTELGELCKFLKLPIRLGSYGDPASILYSVWHELLTAANTGHTGYTHQWTHPNFDSRIFDYCMASVDNVHTVERLQKLYPGVRYYRMTNNIETLARDEIMCPSDPNKLNIDGSRTVTCNKCKLCNGKSTQAKNIVVKEIK